MKLFYQIVGFAILLLSCHPFKAANAFVVSRGGNVNSVPCSKTSPSTACYNVYSTGRSQRSQSQLNLLAPMPFVDTDTLHSIVTTASPSLVISETEPWVKPLSQVLGPFLNLFSFAMLCRVVISWYPKSNLNEFPYNLVVWPTEPLLRGIRGTVPPAFGVDITPIVWLAVFTFFNEILLGQQGLLTMKMKYGI